MNEYELTRILSCGIANECLSKCPQGEANTRQRAHVHMYIYVCNVNMLMQMEM